MLAEKKSLEAPGGALTVLNYPDEPHLGPHLPLPRGQETYLSVGRALSPALGMLEDAAFLLAPGPGLPGSFVSPGVPWFLGI